MTRRRIAITATLLTLPCALLAPDPTAAQDVRVTSRPLERPVANPVVVSQEFRRAVTNGTRTETGVPGPNYWQQSADYTITARLDVEAKRLEGTTRILYRNASPDSLRTLVLQLIQNFHREDALRHRPAEITGGYAFTRVAVEGQDLAEVDPGRRPGYTMSYPTLLLVYPPAAVPPRDSVVLELEWSFTIPQAGVGGRMGWDEDDFFFLAYWYPQMAVFDDVVRWHTDPFLGLAEFYAGFGAYDVTLDVPEGWLVQGTGELRNAREVLPDHILARLRQAAASDTVVHVISQADLDAGFTRAGTDGRLRWHFTADSVRDAAYSITRGSLWDVTRAEVGDRDGDGQPEYTRAEAIFRPSHQRWYQTARYAQQSIAFHSRHTGVSYPYSHATAVEGDGIIGGGMEYPMMTMIGGYDQSSDRGMYSVTSHELAHNWVPMIVSTDERRRAWMDEGTTDYNENRAFEDFFLGSDPEAGEFGVYVGQARTGFESALMRYSDYLDSMGHYGVYAYQKPGSLLIALRHLLGEDVFNRAYQGYLRTWAFKHPKPWDFFNYFNTSTGQNLDWFWRTWYFETWALDQSIASVTPGPNGTDIVVHDLGDAAMPTRLTITLAGGDTLHREIPVTTWLGGARTATVTVPRGREVTQVEIDAAGEFPDAMRKNNFWGGETQTLPASWPTAVRNDLVRWRALLLREGYRADAGLLSGTAAARATDPHTVHLEGGVEYAILAVCDADCLDIDLRIRGPADSTLAEDVAGDDTPVVRFTAPSTGDYALELIMFACNTDACGWGGQILRRP